MGFEALDPLQLVGFPLPCPWGGLLPPAGPLEGGMKDAAVTAFGRSPGRRHKDIRDWACIKAGRKKRLIFIDRSRPLFDDQIKMRGENKCFREKEIAGH